MNGILRALLAVLLVLSGVATSLATDIFPGAVAGRWTAEDSPYLVLGTIWVNGGDTLQVDPGTEIIMTGYFSLDSYGVLNMMGTPDSVITITSGNYPQPSEWNRVMLFDCGTTGTIQYVHFTGADVGVWIRPNADRDGGVCSPTIRACEFEKTRVGIYVDLYQYKACWCTYHMWSEPLIEGCYFHETDSPIYARSHIEMYHYPWLENYMNPTIRNCIFDGNTNESIYILVETYRQWNQSSSWAYSDPIIENNVFTNEVEDVIFYAIASGGGIEGSIKAYVTDNVFMNSDLGLAVRQSYSGKATASAHNNDFWNVTTPCEGCGSGFGRVDRVNANGDSCDVFENLYVDPKMIDPNGGNFRLRGTSPAINAGLDEAELNDLAFPPGLGNTTGDMGAFGGQSNAVWKLPELSIDATPRQFDFGAVIFGKSALDTVFLSNPSAANVTVTSIASLDTASAFVAQVSTPFVLRPGKTTIVPLHFTPSGDSVSVELQDELWVQSNGGTLRVIVSGEGVPLQLPVDVDLQPETTRVFRGEQLKFDRILTNASIRGQTFFHRFEQWTEGRKIWEGETTSIFLGAREQRKESFVFPVDVKTPFGTYELWSVIWIVDGQTRREKSDHFSYVVPNGPRPSGPALRN